jgi:hypothetical protein
MEPSEADRIWNRTALGDKRAPALLAGDRHLAALLRVHGMVMNGGPDHAADTYSQEELSAAVAAFEYFGFGDVATVVGRIAELKTTEHDEEWESPEMTLDRDYNAVVWSDQVLADAFERKLAATS